MASAIQLSEISSVSAKPGAAEVSVDQLLAEDSATLEQRFQSARWEGPLHLEGHPVGRMLAVPGFDRGLVQRVLAAISVRALNPWQGKSFGYRDDGAGVGTNRCRVLGVRFTAFRFKTYPTESVVDGAPAFAIDYDTPETPSYARATYDELRPVAPGLFLGRGMKKRPGRDPKLLVWFALDLRSQDLPVRL